jgi:hypothetical protein
MHVGWYRYVYCLNPLYNLIDVRRSRQLCCSVLQSIKISLKILKDLTGKSSGGHQAKKKKKKKPKPEEKEGMPKRQHCPPEKRRGDRNQPKMNPHIPHL